MRARAAQYGIAAGLMAVLAGCAGALFTAPPGSAIALNANPPFVPSDGGVSAITALVVEPAGTLVPDGTVVLFFTDIGHIDPQGKTRNGVAHVTFVSDSRSGVAHITAVSGGAAPTVSASPGMAGGSISGSGAASIEVTVGNARVKLVCCLRADPPRITVSNSTHVFARVLDENGNGIPSVPVFFKVVADPATEFFDVTGPVFTNNNGEAEDVMRTRRQTLGNAQVRAEAPGPGVIVASDPLIIAIQ